MNEIRKKQKKLYKIMKALVIFGAAFIFIFIGLQPTIKAYNQLLATVLMYVCDAVVVAVLVFLFSYYSKYGKCDSIMTAIENEINDNGYYLTSRKERENNSYIDAVYHDLKNCGYSMNKDVEIADFEFSFKAMKKKEYFYCADVDGLDKNDVLAYLDTVITDVTVNSLKRKGNGVLCLITDMAEDDAISLSKMITPLGKKEQLKIAIAICELSTGRVYFLGNTETKCQQIIANFVMNCDVPIKEQYICRDKLPFQFDLAEKVKELTLKDIKSDYFSVH